MEIEKKFCRVKENVWHLSENDNEYAVKRYVDTRSARKIRKVHEYLNAVNYPFCAPVTKKGNAHIVVQPWLTGASPVDFAKRADRRASLTALEALHATGEFIDWKSLPFLQPYSLLEKWNWRLERFRNNRSPVASYIGEDAVDQIIQYSEQALVLLQTAPIREVPDTLLHGDVVHHNLLKTPDGNVCLIDFDLACTGHPDIEVGLWLHRVLPKVEYDAPLLFAEEPRLQALGQQAVAMMQYPNELLREWTYILTLPDKQREAIAKQHVPFTEKALIHWPDVCRFSNSLLEQDRKLP